MLPKPQYPQNRGKDQQPLAISFEMPPILGEAVNLPLAKVVARRFHTHRHNLFTQFTSADRGGARYRDDNQGANKTVKTAIFGENNIRQEGTSRQPNRHLLGWLGKQLESIKDDDFNEHGTGELRQNHKLVKRLLRVFAVVSESRKALK